MPQGPKTIIDEMVNSAMMITPEIPEVGVAVTGILAGGLFLFDIFFPDDDSDILTDPPLSSEDLADVVDQIKQAIADQSDADWLRDHWDEVATLADGLSKNWADVTASVDSTQLTKDERLRQQYKTFLAPWDNDLTRMRNAMADPIDSASSPLKSAISIFVHHPDKQYMTVPLYLYTVNTFILYCKLNTMWDYREALADKDEYKDLAKILKDQFAKTNPTLIAAVTTWIQNGKQGPNPIDAIVDAKVWSLSPYVTKLMNYLEDTVIVPGQKIGESAKGYITHLTDFADRVEAARASYHTKLNKRLADLNVVQDAAGAWTVHDASTGKDLLVPGVPSQALAKINAKTYSETFDAEIYKEEVEDLNFDQIDAAYIAKLRKIAAHWEKINTSAGSYLQAYTANQQAAAAPKT